MEKYDMVYQIDEESIRSYYKNKLKLKKKDYQLYNKSSLVFSYFYQIKPIDCEYMNPRSIIAEERKQKYREIESIVTKILKENA